MAITSEKEYQDALSELHSLIDCPIAELFEKDIEKLESEMREWDKQHPLQEIEENESHKAQLHKLGFWDNYRP
ncbi:hypothetical protein F0267_28270 [Vibrio coralliilyticus]|uniref:Uncharacterized protein n=2 Tax=Vibrio TaxID=662 RepID=A0AAN0SKB3_9VIBR|nr:MULTISPECIES: hypothetical protein [Vibrio]AIW22502.1 hypothetical protein IX92_25905 [Vibrio coralliilyticus]NOH42131.1 hypothetical protein [Vibrio coralliilyticus]POB47322.1 hypothetical protein CRN52_14670 [Vibrio vulnificus]